jgi:hypothetical protein
MTPNLLTLGLLVATLAPADLGQRERGDASPKISCNLEGTDWKGEASIIGDMIFRFERGGVLDYTSPAGRFRKATWKQEGDSVYIEINDRFAEYRGTIRGDTLAGTADNIKDKHWTWSAKRVLGDPVD